MDAPVLAFLVLAALAAGVLFGVAPAWQISRLNRYELLKEGGRSNSAGRGRQQLRSWLVVAEVALALVLRSLVAPLYLIASVGISFLAALGLSVLLFIKICRVPATMTAPGRWLSTARCSTTCPPLPE